MTEKKTTGALENSVAGQGNGNAGDIAPRKTDCGGSRGSGRERMERIRTEFRTGGGVCTTVTTRTVRFLSSSAMCEKTLSPGARGRMEAFYSQVDWDLGEEERELRRKAKKARRKAKRRIRKLLKAATAGNDPKLRAEAQGIIIDLLAGKDRAHA